MASRARELSQININDYAPINSPSFTGTVSFPSGSASAPSISASGDTNTGIFFPSADTLALSEGGTEAMRIDSFGRITAPFQTSCIAYLGSDQSISANTWTKVNLNQTTFNIGNNFNTSNGRFVAPVAGRYFVGYTMNFNSGGFSGYLYSGIQINGSFTFYGEGRNSSAAWNGDNTLGNGQLVNLSANDFVELYAYSAGTNSLASGTLRTHLSAHLLS